MSDEELKLLVHKRGQVKSKVTRIRNSLKAAEDDPTTTSFAQLRVFARSLEIHYREYNEIHDALISACLANQRDPQEKKYEEFEVLFNETSLVIESLKDAKVPEPIGAAAQPAAVQPQIVQQQALKAPLPTFDGKYEHWPRFKAMFQDIMGRSPDCDAIKLYHLEKSLVGAATGVIDSQTIQDNNYAQAWAILEERYENKRLIVDLHIRGLLNLKRMTRKSSKELRQLLDDCCRHVENLKFLGQELEGVSELFVVNVLTAALDKETREYWESKLDHGELPTYEDTVECLKNRCLILERCETANPPPPVTKSASGFQKLSSQKVANAVTSPTAVTCELCSGQHPNFKCSAFRNMTVAQRIAKVKEMKVCYNCLRKGHRSSTCSSEKTCSKCGQRHNSLLHLDDPDVPEQPEPQKQSAPPASVNVVAEASPEPVSTTSALVSHVSSTRKSRSSPKEVLLLTALVSLVDESGRAHPCRALLDCASQVCLISSDMVQKLGKRPRPTNTEVVGVTGRKSASQEVVVSVVSNYGEYKVDIPCLVMPQVSGTIPTRKIEIKRWQIPANVALADPEFHTPKRIDLLIGNEFFFSLLKSGQMKLSDDLPLLQETVFGWVIAGPVDVPDQKVVFSHVVTKEDTSDLIEKFWAVEEVVGSFPSTTEEQQVEDHFVDTHRRDETGRFVVRLPFRETVAELGDNRALALKRFFLLERRLQRHPDTKQQYEDFITEYEALGHCHEVFEAADPQWNCYLGLPHHAVMKLASSSTKLRVVFDATARSSGPSLNDVLQVGPTIQNDLFSILLQFRRHRFAFSADITKMYRQVVVDERDTRFQRIFWGKQPTDPLRVLELNTVTYGTASAPFLATRSLVQLARDEKSEYPAAAEVVCEDFYIDDVLTGANTVAEAVRLRMDLQEMLAKGGFDIRKWCSNSDAVLEDVPEEEKEKLVKIDDSENIVRTLGLLWDPNNDHFRFVVPSTEDMLQPVTKRFVLSRISRLFDPLGFVSPVVLVAKLLMQALWVRKLEWDEPIPEDLLAQWLKLSNSLTSLNQAKIPRCVIPEECETFEIHGFADASSSAYGACLYLRAVKGNGDTCCNLFTSKSRVAPLTEMTIPRKELCAALLLSRLLVKVLSAFKLPMSKVVLWSDSQIVLSWLKKAPSRLDIFVRNRVAEINRNTHQYPWEYVRSADNPADVVSRGQMPEALNNNSLWWFGPDFLNQPHYEPAAVEEIPDCEMPEMKAEVIVNLATIELLPVFTSYGSFRKLQRIVALVMRFINNTRTNVAANRCLWRSISVAEMRASLITIVRVIQHTELPDEVRSQDAATSSKKLARLCPVLDEVDGVLRVGGRLEKSALPFDAKHQLILPDHHPVTKLLIRALHEENMHAGPSNLLAILRRKFWLLRARSTVRGVVRSCVSCFRACPRKVEQLMGNLPDFRVNPAMPFEYTGVDYAGPVMVKEGKYRPKR
ncbi:uncharacterized protein LOC134286610 [Aedes albopictus]|uniref:CCHC-type domain-containing protein n=1 Tax=Aedes albopictus TaxID=7160 RepID=A0ABM1Y635_AEDAL